MTMPTEPTIDPADTDPPALPDNDPGADPAEGEFTRDYVEKLRRENAKYRTRVRELEPAAKKAADLEAAGRTEAEKAVAAARAEAEQQTAAKYRGHLVKAEVRSVAAALRFRDPADAVRLLDLDEIEVNDDGSVDGDALKAALAAVAEKKPYLVEETGPQVPRGKDIGLGVNGGGKDFGKFSPADFEREFYGSK